MTSKECGYEVSALLLLTGLRARTLAIWLNWEVEEEEGGK